MRSSFPSSSFKHKGHRGVGHDPGPERRVHKATRARVDVMYAWMSAASRGALRCRVVDESRAGDEKRERGFLTAPSRSSPALAERVAALDTSSGNVIAQVNPDTGSRSSMVSKPPGLA